VTIVGEGTESFAEITFTKPGEYIYTVYERNDGVDNYIYDDSVYYIHEEVSYDSNGQLVASCSVYDDDGCGAKQPEISFINLYDDDIPIPSEESSSPQITTTPEETTPTGETETSVTENPTKSTEPSETTTSDSTDKTTGTVNNTDTPKTSDDTNNVPWVVILCVALVGMVSLNVVKYHRKKQDDRKNGQ
jgi:pilin isopeptide linkage protein